MKSYQFNWGKVTYFRPIIAHLLEDDGITAKRLNLNEIISPVEIHQSNGKLSKGYTLGVSLSPMINIENADSLAGDVFLDCDIFDKYGDMLQEKKTNT